ncbi:MAG: ABC transporter ATP-binding protein [Gammaproteobacteria bacterium]|nr:ABC transporter ATP-binding protein [Gammaproteobacteria bacterium]
MLEVSNLTVDFRLKGKEVSILKDISFSLGKRQTLGIVGESGSGKSVTAMSVLKLISTPPLQKMSGQINYRGRDLLMLSDREMRAVRGKEIGFVFQEPMTALNPVLTIGEQITEVILAHEKTTKREARERAVDLLKETGISTPARRMRNYPHEMSGGMRQRAMIAMALSCGPRVLIADEPTTALDVTIQAQILGLFEKLQEERRMSLIFITHDLGVIAEIADQVLVMVGGRVAEYAPVDKIFHAPAHAYTRKLLALLPGGVYHARP